MTYSTFLFGLRWWKAVISDGKRIFDLAGAGSDMVYIPTMPVSAHLGSSMPQLLLRSFSLCILIFLTSVEAFGQSRPSKKKGPIDLFGPVIGFSMLIDNGDRDGDGTLHTLSNIKTPLTPTVGASYHRYLKRWSHIFQSRYASSRLLYDEVRLRHDNVNGERILYRTEIGPTTIKFSSFNILYQLGYCINKPARIYIYLGPHLGKTTVDKSNREVDIVTFGESTFVNNSKIYTTYPEPVLSHGTLLAGFPYEFTAEILGRLETRMNLSDKLFFIPSIEVAYDLHHIFYPYRYRMAVMMEVGYIL